MATYAIGDIQGCFEVLEKLLSYIQFNPTQDTLWFTGDLVNRGPQSLEVLRFVKQLGERHRIVLGNHDLHLLAVSHKAHAGWQEDTFSDILAAPDKDELLNWLKQQPLLHHDETLGYAMVHAGLAPQWTLSQAIALSKEVQLILQSDRAIQFFQHMYGNEPPRWDDELQSWDRLRCITNYFTRLRFCYADGSLELNHKGTVATHPKKLLPWFKIPNRATAQDNIIFGHWAALGGITNTPHTFAVDTGCVWGFKLTAMRLEDQTYFSVDALH